MTLPIVKKLDNIEMIRDGGSFAATFQSEDNGRYILFLKLNIEDNGINEKRTTKRIAYHMPVLIDTDPKKRPSNTDTVRYSELNGPSILITWHDAHNILSAITQFTNQLSPLQKPWLDRMSSVVANNGLLE